MELNLKQKTGLVTGAGSGLGRAICLEVARAGANVAVCDIDSTAATAVVKEIESEGGSALACTADVTDEAQVASAVAAARERFGAIDFLNTSHGNVRPALFHKMSIEAWSTVVDVHLNGTFHVVRAVIDPMREQGYGRILTMTSPAGVQGAFGQANYAAAKGGIIALTKSLAREYARTGITANALNPVAATPMTEKVRTDPKLEGKFLGMVPMRRWAEPEEIAPLAAFLLSPQAGYMTGQVVAINGGLTM